MYKMLKEESVGDRTRCLNLFPPPWAHSQSVGWAQEHKGTPHKGTREYHIGAQLYKDTLHKGTPHKRTQGYIANYWLWVRHSITPLQLFIISCTLVRQNTIVLHCIFKTAYWCSKCILLDTNYCTLYIGTADVHNTMCWKSIQQCSWPTVLSQ